MEVSYDERRAMLYRDLERGDVVVGRINNIREYGFFLTLLCTAVGLKRDIEDLELSVGFTRFIIHNFDRIFFNLSNKANCGLWVDQNIQHALPGNICLYCLSKKKQILSFYYTQSLVQVFNPKLRSATVAKSSTAQAVKMVIAERMPAAHTYCLESKLKVI